MEEKGMSNLIRIEKGRAIVSLNLVGWRTIGKRGSSGSFNVPVKKRGGRGAHLCTLDQLLETLDYSIARIHSLFSFTHLQGSGKSSSLDSYNSWVATFLLLLLLFLLLPPPCFFCVRALLAKLLAH